MYPDFVPRFPWLGGDLQTLRYYFFPASEDLSAWPAERLRFPLPESGGDALLAVLHRPNRPTDRPLVILVHGLTGCEGSTYMFETARSFLTLGYPVMRLNLRGAGPSRETCRGSYCAGSGGEIGAVLSALASEDVARGVVLVGFSLGGTVVLDYLARHPHPVSTICAVSVSAPLDLAAAIRRMIRPPQRAVSPVDPQAHEGGRHHGRRRDFLTGTGGCPGDPQHLRVRRHLHRSAQRVRGCRGLLRALFRRGRSRSHRDPAAADSRPQRRLDIVRGLRGPPPRPPCPTSPWP